MYGAKITLLNDIAVIRPLIYHSLNTCSLQYHLMCVFIINERSI